jgi:hypothetical protein
MQNRVFDAFSERLDAVIEARAQAGLLDVGLETVKADKIEKDSEQVVHTDRGERRRDQVRQAHARQQVQADRLRRRGRRQEDAPGSSGSPRARGKVYAVAEAPSLTDERA